MLLSQFFKNAPEIEIKQISCDSRMPMEDCIFFCAKGIKDDGHNFVKEAITNGAKVIVYDKPIDSSLPAIYIKVNDVLDALNQVANKFYNHPGKMMENFVVAGSFGRNSVAFFIQQIISNYCCCGYIGSYGINYQNTKLLSSEPTLTVLENQRHLLNMKDSGVGACVFEASFLGIELKKLDGVYPNALIYTNSSTFSREYLNMDENSADSIIRYINHFDNSLDLIFNLDDAMYKKVAPQIDREIITYSIQNPNANFYASDIHIDDDGSRFLLTSYQSTYEVETNLIGLLSVYNLLSAIAALVTRGYPLNEVVAACKHLVPPEGTMQRIHLGQKYNVIVDSANNYGSILNVLKFARSVVDANHKIVCLFGLTAFSSHDKRHELGKLVDEYADTIILTEHDPYELSVFTISNEIEEGITHTPCVIIENREDAIASAIELLNDDDMLLVLGMGNANYIYRSLGKESYPKDAVIVEKYIKKRMEEENETL